jgi:hypothetical protein
MLDAATKRRIDTPRDLLGCRIRGTRQQAQVLHRRLRSPCWTAIHTARVGLHRRLAARLRDRFKAVWTALAPTEAYAPDA